MHSFYDCAHGPVVSWCEHYFVRAHVSKVNIGSRALSFSGPLLWRSLIDSTPSIVLFHTAYMHHCRPMGNQQNFITV